MLSKIPRGRFLQIEELASMVTWLASEESAGVTGRVFDVSGQALSVSEGWHRGPTAQPVDDPALVGRVGRMALALIGSRGD